MRSMPKRAMSNRLAATAMNSIAQQAVPNGIGQRLLARAQLTRKSSRVVTQFGEICETSAPEACSGLEFNSIPAPPVSRRR